MINNVIKIFNSSNPTIPMNKSHTFELYGTSIYASPKQRKDILYEYLRREVPLNNIY